MEILNKVRITPGFYIVMAVILLVVPMPWIAVWMAASAVHELSHVAAVKIMGGRILTVTVTGMGAEIQADGLSVCGQVLCGLAGPAGGMCLVLLLHIWPEIALCGMFQSIYHLLPIYPLDGGRAMRTVLQCCFSARTAKITEYAISLGVLLLITVGSVCLGIFLHAGEIPTVFTGMLWIRTLKIPCKQMRQGVQ